VTVEYVTVFTMREGRGVRVDTFYDREEALTAARGG
jgi:hypothetical protein